jgi:signal peptidase II
MQGLHDSRSPHGLGAGTTARSADPSESRASLASRCGKLRLLLIVAGLVVTLDQLLKLWVDANRPQMELLPGLLDLVYVINHGAAFGLLAGRTDLLIALGIAGSIAILVFFRFFSPRSTLGVLAFALVLGGALGNLVDRIRLGYVIDFASFRFVRWPPFNVADAAITVGIAALLYYFYRSGSFSKGYDHGHGSGG